MEADSDERGRGGGGKETGNEGEKEVGSEGGRKAGEAGRDLERGGREARRREKGRERGR